MVYDKIIEGMTVDLRSVEITDAEITYKMRIDSEKTKYMHSVNGTVQDQRNYIERQRVKSDDYLFLVMDKQEKVIGMRGIYNVTETTAESGRTIGYGDAFQNIEALLLGLDFAFDTLGVKKVLMDAATENHFVRGIQIQLGAKEYKRGFYPGLDYEFVFSELEYNVYEGKRKKIMEIIRKHIQRRQR